MSEPMVEAKKNVEKILEKLRESTNNDFMDIAERLKVVEKIIAQNQNKIWLRTKTGKPMAEELQETTAKILVWLHESTRPNLVMAAMNDLEDQAKRIAEESRQRGMVVT